MIKTVRCPELGEQCPGENCRFAESHFIEAFLKNEIALEMIKVPAFW